MIGNREIKTQIRFDFVFIFDICNTKIKLFSQCTMLHNFQSDITIENAELNIRFANLPDLDGLAQ